MTYPELGAVQASRTVDYDYAHGWLRSVKNLATGQSLLTNATYHPSGLLASLPLGNGFTAWNTADPFGMARPSRLYTTGVSSGTNFDTGAYAYDAAGNVTAIGTSSFAYDEVSRLTAATVCLPPQSLLFSDGFETGDPTAWSGGEGYPGSPT